MSQTMKAWQLDRLGGNLTFKDIGERVTFGMLPAMR
jgi:hypothetical protein